jgi:hypothetical protein
MPQPTGLRIQRKQSTFTSRARDQSLHIFGFRFSTSTCKFIGVTLPSGRRAPTTQNAHQLMKIADGEETLAVLSCAEFSSQA